MFFRLLNPSNRWRRWLIKLCFFLLVAAGVIYPNPVLFVRNIRHWQDLSALVRADDPRLDLLATNVQDLAQHEHANDLRAVEKVVYTRWPYAYDWQTWGVANYLPTLDETFTMPECDCKGRAVAAASILAHMGYKASLMCDGSHFWVSTPEGEAMSPVRTASGRTVIGSSAQGNQIDLLALFSPAAIFVDWPTRLGFATSVFPPIRVGILVFVLWCICVRLPWRPQRALICLAIMSLGVVILARSSPHIDQASPIFAWIGIVLLVVGVWILGIRLGPVSTSSADNPPGNV